MIWRIILFLLIGHELNAQSLWEQQLEQNSLSEQNPDALEQWANQLQNWEQRPIEINLWSRRQLMETGLFNVFQVHNLIQYRERYGSLLSLVELSLIKGFEKERIKMLAPILSFETKEKSFSLNWRSFQNIKSHQLAWRWQLNQRNLDADQKNNYRGDPIESRLVYRAQSRSGLTLGMTLQKDPGEGWHLPYGFDHMAAYLQYQRSSNWQKLLAGDFHFSFGQGLSLWSGSAFNATGFDQPFLRYARGISAFAGSEEQRFFRGAAASYRMKTWRAEAFISFRELDASLTKTKAGMLANIRSGGYHRNEKELGSKDQLPLKSLGMALHYEGKSFDLSLLHHQHYFAIPLIEASDLSESHKVEGKSYYGYALAGQFLWQQFHLFGEWAMDQEADWALNLGWERNWWERFKFRQAWRKFQVNYQGFWNDARARSGSAGEFGILHQIEANWTYQWRSLLEVDYYEFPWPRYQIEGPSAGRRISFIQEWRPKSSQSIELSIRNQKEEKWDGSSLNRDPALGRSSKENWQIRFVHKQQLSSFWSSRSSLQFYLIPKNWHQVASFLSQQWTYKSGSWRHSLCFSLANDPSSLALFYDYEPDLLRSFSIPAYRGQSLRLSIYSRWKSRKWQAEAKLAFADDIYYSNAQIELKLQLHYSF